MQLHPPRRPTQKEHASQTEKLYTLKVIAPYPHQNTICDRIGVCLKNDAKKNDNKEERWTVGVGGGEGDTKARLIFTADTKYEIGYTRRQPAHPQSAERAPNYPTGPVAPSPL